MKLPYGILLNSCFPKGSFQNTKYDELIVNTFSENVLKFKEIEILFTNTFLTFPVDGSWTSWGSWASCSETCGGGVQSRTRSCSNPAPQYGGANCVGMSSSTQRCNTQNCPSKLSFILCKKIFIKMHINFNLLASFLFFFALGVYYLC